MGFMKRFFSFAGAAFMFGSSFSVSALPNDVSQVFDRNKRKLDTPPSSLRSDDVNAETRYSVAEDSLEDAMQVNTDAEGATQTDLDSQPIQDLSGGEDDTYVYPPKRKVVVNSELRSQERAAKLEEYAFSGKRIFGVGFIGAGAYGIFGAEIDFGFNDEWTGGLGIGTGMTYATWGLHARRFFQQGSLTPYFQVGYANWVMNSAPREEKDVFPLYLGEQFLLDNDGNYKVGEHVHLVYPAIGVIFQSSSGLAFQLHLQYLLSALNFTGALAGSFGFYFYF